MFKIGWNMMWAGIGVILSYVFPFDVGSYSATRGTKKKNQHAKSLWGLGGYMARVHHQDLSVRGQSKNLCNSVVGYPTCSSPPGSADLILHGRCARLGGIDV